MLVGDDGTFRVVTAADGDTLDTLQRLVDGLIERVAVPLPAAARSAACLDMWVNEEGLMRDDFAVNDHAAQMVGSLLVGPVVLAGCDAEDTTGLDEILICALRDVLVDAGATEIPPAATQHAADQQRASREQRRQLGFRGHGLRC